MKRRVWSLDELSAILRAVALAGGDPRTLAILSVALGVEHALPDGRGLPDEGQVAINAQMCYNGACTM